MKYKKFLIECSKDYAARIFRCPQCMNDCNFTLHWHRDIEFIYVEKGPLKVLKADKQLILNDGDIYFMNSEEVHSYADVTGDLRFIVVNIPPKALLPYIDNPASDDLVFWIKNENAKRQIARTLKSLAECIEDSRISILRIKAILNIICYWLIKDCKADNIKYIKGSDSEDFSCAKSAVVYMQKNYKKYIPLNEIANYVGMTPAHFSKYFKDKTEVTFSRYLRKIRLEHAIYDMLYNNKTVNVAAKDNGFPNVNSFIITCKEEYGRTPLEMKNYQKT